MATPETIGVTTCGGCKRDADVKLNAGGFSYYHCGCGHSERTHNQSSSRRFVQSRMRPLNFEKPDEPREREPQGEAGNPAPAGQTTPPAASVKQPNTKPEQKSGFRFF